LLGRTQRVSWLAVRKSVKCNVNSRVIHAVVIFSEIATGTIP